MTPPIMRFIRARTHSRQTLFLVAAGITMLACAGTGLAGAMGPLPTRKPESALQAVAYETSSSTSAPVPSVKPVGYIPMLLPTGQDDVSAADLAAIEPSAFTPRLTVPAPIPSRKPDFAEPDVAMLLAFGQPPLPRAKPGARSMDALSDRDAAIYRQIFS